MSVFVEVCKDKSHALARKAELEAELGGTWNSAISEGHEEVFSDYVPDSTVAATRGPDIYSGSQGGLSSPVCVLLMWSVA